MGTVTRPELSKKSRYWIDRHRYYELKHFCLQYPLWKKAYSTLDGYGSRSDEIKSIFYAGYGDPTFKCAEMLMFYFERMRIVEKAAKDTHEEFADYILKAVTEGYSYDILKARLDIPCCKDVYYELYRRFFWLLSRARK